MSFSDQLARLRPIAQQHATSLPTPYPRYVLFFSVTDGQDRAQVVHARAASFEAAWQEGVEAIRKVLRKHKLSGDWLRVDWVEAAETLPWEVLHSRLAATKRNYFRHGLALSADFTLAFLEQELNANAMLYAGSDVAQARINPKNFNVYAASRFGVEIDFDHPVKDPVVFTTGAAYCERTGPAYRLASSGLEAGRRLTGRLAEKDVLALVNTGGSFLARQVKRSGEFVYGYFPCFNREIPTYNALRHASSTYALIEAWEATGDRSLRPAIERALGYLTRELIRRTHAPDGTELAFLVEKNDEIKLGGNAVSLLALVKYCEVSGDKTHLPLLESLAQGIAFMQEPKSGRLNHVLHFPDLSVKEDFRIIYYDGEAAFGLMRLYGLTRDARWLSVVEKAFDYFIARKHWTAHDHWLSYCVNELTRYCDDEKYYRFGLQNVSGYLDFVLERETTFPTLLELMMAAQQMLERLQQQPDKRHLLALIDLDKFYHALEHRAHYLQNGYFWPEMAMFFKKPARIVGSFFIRHHAFRVRIDDVEHYLSGLVAYLRYCRAGRPVVEAPAVAAPALAATWQGGDNWNAERVTQATGGQWLSPPPSDWSATGLCVWAPAMQPGNMVLTKRPGGSRGVLVDTARRMQPPPAALITDEPQLIPPEAGPTLVVADAAQAIIDLGRYARSQMKGTLIGVTGSSGKTTTVAMLTHILEAWGEVGQTRHNANLPHGIAWNLASMPWGAPYTVMEMAIGRMAENTQLVRPNMAVFTNIAPAHLEYHGTTAEVARKKSAIFDGMQAGEPAILNRDMLEWPIVHDAALRNRLQVVPYGRHPESRFRLLDYSPTDGVVQADLAGQTLRYRVGAPGEHMALNSLAVLAAVTMQGLDLAPALERLETFAPLPGRGARVARVFDGKPVEVLDEAYNANPASMEAALRLLAAQAPHGGRRLLVLGDMLELGPDAPQYHAALAPAVQAARADRIYLCGPMMQHLAQALEAAGVKAWWFPEVEALQAVLFDDLAAHDFLLIKSSAGTRLSEIVEALQSQTPLETA